MVKNLPKWNETLTKISLDKFEAKLSEAKKSVSMRAQINKQQVSSLAIFQFGDTAKLVCWEQKIT